MSLFVDALLVSEIFISSMVIFSLYYLFFTNKHILKKSRRTIFVFSVILFIFLQHVAFEVARYFLESNDLNILRFVANFLFVPLMFFMFFEIRRNVDIKMLVSVVSFYGLAIVFVGISWFYESSLIFGIATILKIFTSILFYVLVIEFLIISK